MCMHSYQLSAASAIDIIIDMTAAQPALNRVFGRSSMLSKMYTNPTETGFGN